MLQIDNYISHHPTNRCFLQSFELSDVTEGIAFQTIGQDSSLPFAASTREIQEFNERCRRRYGLLRMFAAEWQFFSDEVELLPELPNRDRKDGVSPIFVSVLHRSRCSKQSSSNFLQNIVDADLGAQRRRDNQPLQQERSDLVKCRQCRNLGGLLHCRDLLLQPCECVQLTASWADFK